MNSLVTSFRTALRFQPARTFSPCCRGYSTVPPVESAPSSEPAPSLGDSASQAAPSSGSSQLDAVIKNVAANKGKGRQAHQGGQRRGPLPSDYAQLYSSPSARSAYGANPSTPEQIWAFTPPVKYTPPVTLTSARSFAVRDGNVARAYRNLNRTLRENNVRLELRRQERFESPSNKRVRLNSERHRRRFKVAVGKAVALAMRMKDK
ncbi:hypothetical protein BMF94_4435 [Rhodotorula taiwanensis]|uniref:Ribosomal protein S21 n=1 Tax=Rhodotorula taiwanensis TaxID=741276 RepID=A0A2S5B766_9BASI|nr:hypothetical protein BMF94_4435 [Rhodotorula taiwanensis]